MRRVRDELKSLRGDATVVRMMKDTGWLFGSNALNLVLGFATSVLVARMLGIVQFGKLTIVIGFVVIVNALTSFRMREFVVRYVSAAMARGERERAAAVAKAGLGAEGLVSGFAFAVAFLLAPWAGRVFLHSVEGAALIRIYTYVILANLVAESTQGVLQAFGDFPRMAMVATAQQLARFAGILVLFLSGGDAAGVLKVYVGAQALAAVIRGWIAGRRLSQHLGRNWWRVRLTTLRRQARSMAGFAFNTNLSSTLALVGKRIDTLFLGAYRSAAEAGYFGLGQTLVGISFLPVAPLTDPFYPVVSREVNGERVEEVRRLLRHATGMSLLWVVPGGLVALSTVWFLIPLVYGHAFAPAALAFALMWPGAAFAQVIFWGRPTLLALGRPGYPNIVATVASIVKILLLFLLVPRFGYVASAAILSGFAVATSGLLARKVVRVLPRIPGKVDARRESGSRYTSPLSVPADGSTTGMS